MKKRMAARQGNPWVEQTSAATTLVRSVAELERQAIRWWRELRPWWNAQGEQMRLGLVVVGLVALISLFNLTAAGLSRVSASQPAPAATVAASKARPVLTAEAAPADLGKAWVATQLWQGSGSRVTESFTAGSHWRVDWLYNPPQTGGILQVFIYSADGSLLMGMAANTQKSGPDTSFWAGPGTYYLKVNATGGDWKLDVQDLR